MQFIIVGNGYGPGIVKTTSASSRRVTACGFIGILCLVMITGAAWAQSRPNVVLIITDDQGCDAIEGGPWTNGLECHTPELAAMAALGRSFGRCRSNPVCSPSRAGIQTGRYAHRTGVDQVLIRDQDASRAGLQPDETTLGEMLRDAGYATIFADKWHLGNAPDQSPLAQGYDTYFRTSDYLPLDDPIEVGDEHVTRMGDLVRDAVLEHLNDSEDPYFLCYNPIDPHLRKDTSGLEPRLWWKVSSDLLPSGERYYDDDDTDRNRYRACVEALDTELGRLLREINVIDGAGRYNPSSNTLVFITSDNGTPSLVAHHLGRAKGYLHESGVKVPLIVFGTGVPADGATVDALVQHVDFYDTIADIAGVPAHSRGVFERDSVSFADLIGWSPTGVERLCTFSNRSGPDPDQNRASIATDSFNLIVESNLPGLQSTATDMFFDLRTDPDEQHDLIIEGMTSEQRDTYLGLRDAIVDLYPFAVSEPSDIHVDVAAIEVCAVDSRNTWHREAEIPLGHVNRSAQIHHQAYVLLRFDVSNLDALLPPDRTVDDIASAQVILTFARDVDGGRNARTGRLGVFPLTDAWWDSGASYQSVRQSIDRDSRFTMTELPPFVVTRLGENDEGFFLANGAPVSLGRSAALADLVRAWHATPASNDGLVVLAERLEPIGDQYVEFDATATLRLSLR